MGLQKCGVNVNRAFQELKAHGSLEFPCAGYSELYTSQFDNIVPWHWHEEMEILYVRKGNVKLQIPGKCFELRDGDCFAINGNILHYAEASLSSELQSLVFSTTLITGGQESVYAQKYVKPLANTSFDGYWLKGEEAEALIQGFVKAFEALAFDLPGFEFTVREGLSRICFFLYQQFQGEIQDGGVNLNQDGIRIRKMLDYIQEHFRDNITLTDIAGEAGIGERECLRCFQRTIQLSPMQYLLKYRIMQGADLLVDDPAISVSEAAALCGFDSPSNFAKMFKRFYNSTPREYRKLNLGK